MKRFSILLASLALAFTASSTGINTPNAKQTHAATGDEHKLVFKGNYRERNYAESAAGWWGEGMSFSGGVATIISTNAAYFSNGAAVADTTYVISYDLKTEGSATVLFQSVLPAWSLISQETVNHADYVHYDLIYTAPSADTLAFYFTVTGTINVKNLYVYDTTTMSVTEGGAIGELPTITPVEGKKTYWSIDGQEIKTGDTYNYSTDKVVTLTSEELCSITYHNGGFVDLASDSQYWNSATGLGEVEDGVLHMQNNDGENNKHVYTFADPSISQFAVGKQYKLSFDLKCDNLYIVVAVESPWITLNSAWTNLSDFKTIEYTFTPSQLGANGNIIFRLNAAQGNAYIKNMHLYEIETVQCQAGQPIGTLPEIENLGEFDEGVWQIDGETITSETLFNYSDSSKNAYAKIELYSATKFVQEWIELRSMEGGFCAVLVDGSASQAKYNELLRKYNSLSAADREIVNNTTDSGDATILNAMNYIENLKKANASFEINNSNGANLNGILSSTTENSNISAIVIVSLLALTSVLAYAFVSKRKRA